MSGSIGQWLKLQESVKYNNQIMYLTRKQVKDNKEQLWYILNNRVYDLRSFLDFHPGGRNILYHKAGSDITKLFYSYHNWVNYEYLLGKCLLGFVID
jgi:cytochrome b involved in lipid metabolism